MSKRHKAAYEIWNVGASNPMGVANALVVVMREVQDEGGDVSNDPAVQMILDHLCFLCGLPQPTYFMNWGRWVNIYKEVEEKAK